MRKPTIFVIAAAVCGIAVMCAVSLAMKNPGTTVETSGLLLEPAPEISEAAAPAPPLSNSYVLRTEDGVIVVCRAETPETPEQITDIAVASLRLYDQLQLEQGIAVEGDENLLRLLEDFVP